MKIELQYKCDYYTSLNFIQATFRGDNSAVSRDVTSLT
jgi:hypothetical protein